MTTRCRLPSCRLRTPLTPRLLQGRQVHVVRPVQVPIQGRPARPVARSCVTLRVLRARLATPATTWATLVRLGLPAGRAGSQVRQATQAYKAQRGRPVQRVARARLARRARKGRKVRSPVRG